MSPTDGGQEEKGSSCCDLLFLERISKPLWAAETLAETTRYPAHLRIGAGTEDLQAGTEDLQDL